VQQFGGKSVRKDERVCVRTVATGNPAYHPKQAKRANSFSAHLHKLKRQVTYIGSAYLQLLPLIPPRLNNTIQWPPVAAYPTWWIPSFAGFSFPRSSMRLRAEDPRMNCSSLAQHYTP